MGHAETHDMIFTSQIFVVLVWQGLQKRAEIKLPFVRKHIKTKVEHEPWRKVHETRCYHAYVLYTAYKDNRYSFYQPDICRSCAGRVAKTPCINIYITLKNTNRIWVWNMMKSSQNTMLPGVHTLWVMMILMIWFLPARYLSFLCGRGFKTCWCAIFITLKTSKRWSMSHDFEVTKRDVGQHKYAMEHHHSTNLFFTSQIFVVLLWQAKRSIQKIYCWSKIDNKIAYKWDENSTTCVVDLHTNGKKTFSGVNCIFTCQIFLTVACYVIQHKKMMAVPVMSVSSNFCKLAAPAAIFYFKSLNQSERVPGSRFIPRFFKLLTRWMRRRRLQRYQRQQRQQRLLWMVTDRCTFIAYLHTYHSVCVCVVFALCFVFEKGPRHEA